MTTSEWLDRLAPKATAILAVGTCATYGLAQQIDARAFIGNSRPLGR
jgi:Ni,Fe-hydrogenase I small subunit